MADIPNRRTGLRASEILPKVDYLKFTVLGSALQRMPEFMSSAIAVGVCEVMARRRSGPQALARAHLQRVLESSSPVAPVDPAILRRWSRRAFRSYAHYWVDGARLPTTPQEKIERRFVFERGFNNLEEGMAAGRGVIMAIPHVGSWEWGGAVLAFTGYPMTSVAERLEPPELFEWFIDQRRAMGLTIVPLGGDSSRQVLQTLKAGGLVGLLCDRDLMGNGVEVELFGERTTLPAGPATLALRTGARLLPTAVYSGPGRHHHAVIEAPVDLRREGSLRQDVTRITQEVATRFEGFIRRSPDQWHLFQPNWPSEREAEEPKPAG